jgi:hypothetical protein
MTTEKIEKAKHNNIYEALSAFQGELKPMPKNGKVTFKTNAGGSVEFAYTPLGDIMATIYPLLAKHGLAIRHEITEKGVEAILTHETYAVSYRKEYVELPHNPEIKENESIKKYPLYAESATPEIKNEIRSGIIKLTAGTQMKDTGAAITYARRYTLTMVLGISSEDDNDASLLEQSAKNSAQFVYDRVKKGLETAKTAPELDKATKVLEKDIVALKNGKAGALGLSLEQAEELNGYGAQLKKQMAEAEKTIE